MQALCGPSPSIGAHAVDFGAASAKEKVLMRKTHQTLKRVTNDFEARWHFNTSIALVMELVNEIHAQEPLEEGVSPAILKRVLGITTLMLYPMTPHIAEEMWEMLGNPRTISQGEMAGVSRGPDARGANRGDYSDQWPVARENPG